MSPLSYRFGTSLLTPILPLFLRYRQTQGKEDIERLDERQGRTNMARPLGQLIWFHAASVGETQMIRPLIERLLQTPERHVLITSGTRTSATLLQDQLPDRAIHQYVPIDTPLATARFMAHWRPDLAVFVESELWPNLIWTAKRANIPLALINARMSQSSLKGWTRRPKFARSVIGAFETVLAADKQTSSALSAIRLSDVPVIGNLKFDAPALTFDKDEKDRLKALIGERPVWLVASTHEAEEPIIHEMIKSLPDCFIIWLPRHPDRGEAIASESDAPRRSLGQDPGGQNLYIMDTLGEMGLALALSDVCVLGGSFHASLKGHNPLEAARARVPLLTGPHIDSFSELYAAMDDQNAVTIANPKDIPALSCAALDGSMAEQTEAASKFSTQHTGILEQTATVLEALL